MKAVRIHGPNDVKVEEIADPEVGPEDVLIKVKAVGICGTDQELADGSMFYITEGLCQLPMTPGHEWSGEVIALGSNVTEFEIGDRVTGECSVGCRSCSDCLAGNYHQCQFRTETGVLNRDGGFAEMIAFPKYFLHKCNDMAFDEATFVEPTGIALAATKLCGVCPNDYVAVMGPGPIGLFAVQTAKAYGAKKVILFGTKEERLAVGRQLGADDTINIKTDDIVEKVKEITNGHMIDVVIEAAGTPMVWEDISAIIAPMGRIGMTGLFGGKSVPVNMDQVVINNIKIFGSLGAPNLWKEVISLFERAMIDAKPLITHRLPLDDFIEGTKISKERRDGAIKVVIEP